MWNQIRLYTEKYSLYESQIETIEDYFKHFIDENDISGRYFYLYEITYDSPLIFFAWETKNKPKVNVPDIPKFMLTHKIVYNSTDYRNGEQFLNIMSAVCKAHLDSKLLKQQPKREKGLLHINHINHCMMNMICGDRVSELNYYTKQYKYYSGKGLNSRCLHVLLDLLKSFRRLFIK